MKYFCLFIFIGITSPAEVVSDSNRTKFSQFIYDRCKKNSLNAAAYDTAKNHLDTFLDYFNYTTNLIPNGKQQFCNDERPLLVNNIQILATDLHSCFRKEESYLPKFVAESFKEFISFLCVNNGLNMDNLFSTAGRECLQSLSQENAGYEVADCFNKIIPRSEYVAKETLCENIGIAKNCFGMSIAKHCPNFPAFQSLNSKFFKSIRKPCNFGYALIVNNLLLIALAFLTVKKVF